MIHPAVIAAACAAFASYYHMSYFKNITSEDIEEAKMKNMSLDELKAAKAAAALASVHQVG